jgi:hypothetical protein
VLVGRRVLAVRPDPRIRDLDERVLLGLRVRLHLDRDLLRRRRELRAASADAKPIRVTSPLGSLCVS